jgi:alpha-D-xyloside xylohydrolase
MTAPAFDPVATVWSRLPPSRALAPARVDAGGVVVETALGAIRITLHDFGARMRIGARANDYGLLVEEPRPAAPSVSESDETLVIDAAGHRFSLEKETLAFTLDKGARRVQQSASDGHFVRRFRLPPFARSDRGWLAHFELQTGEQVYGLGEKWGPLDKRGQLIRSFNSDALGVNAEISYKNTPFAWSPSGWGVFAHTPSPVTHGVGFAPWSQRAYGLCIEDEALDLFVLSGDSGGEILRQYAELTGRAPTPPLWSLGVILSKAYYRTADEILEAARGVRRRGMPCDVITFDGRAWQDTETRFAFEWDKTRYPDPKKVIDELKSLGFRVCVWEYPLVSVKSPLFAEMAEKGWLLKDRRTGAPWRYEWEAEPFGPVLTPLPVSGLVDFTHPDAYAWWRDKHKELFDVGVDMIKADFGEQVLDDMIAHNGETGRSLHNVYAALYNRCVYEAAERYAKSGPFLFSRASWTSCQRYPSQWGGDPQADWEGLAGSLRGGLSWGLSGAPYYATDVGGFYGDRRDPALYVRWAQAAVFSAHIRLHGIGPREPWSYGLEAEAAASAALRLRYRLLPYIERAMREASATGMPVQRAMALACPEEPEAWAFEDQFMFGPDLLVAPCLRADSVVKAYLPGGVWRRFPGRERFEGGRTHRLALALDEFAVFAREGARIPLGPEVLRIEEAWRDAPVSEYWTA